jgi:hypothetical protein
MYCSTCGAAVTRGLAYCNQCGAKLAGGGGEAVAKPAETYPESLVWALVAVFVVGLGAIIGLMAVMKEVVGFSPEIILYVTRLCFLMMLVIEGVFIWKLMRHKAATKEKDAGQVSGRETKELGAAQARALQEPVPSVTEQTTRAFEPVYVERKTK